MIYFLFYRPKYYLYRPVLFYCCSCYHIYIINYALLPIMFVQCITLFIYVLLLYKLSTYNFIDENPHNLTPRQKMVTLRFMPYLRKYLIQNNYFKGRWERERERDKEKWAIHLVSWKLGNSEAYGFTRKIQSFLLMTRQNDLPNSLFPYSIKLLVKTALGHMKEVFTSSEVYS